MRITKVVGGGIVAFALTVAPLASVMMGGTGVAFAKGGNGNGNSGGNSGGGGHGNGGGNGNDGGHGGGGNGGGNGNGGSAGRHEGASSGHGKSGSAHSGKTSTKSSSKDTRTLDSLFSDDKTSIKAHKALKADKPATAGPKSAKSDMAGFSSLNRNYHAYMNSNDPRMAAVSAYAMKYAEFENEFGVDAVPTDPALSDEALREALESFTKGGVVTDDALDRAKDILGVGPTYGKIDQIRDTLPDPEPEPMASETTTTETTTVTVTTQTTTPVVEPGN